MYEFNYYTAYYRQNESVDYIDYVHHYLPDEHEEATDYDVPQKQYKSIRFNKETHPLSLMVRTIHAYISVLLPNLILLKG
jgi:hypothetical protein